MLSEAIQPFPDMRDPSGALLQREYVAGGGWPWYGRIARTLPWAIDDITMDFGDDIYQRMMHDPQVSACVAIFKAGILEHGAGITSAVEDEAEDGYDLAAEIADEAEDMLADLDTPLDDVLWDLLDSVAYGYRVAEQVYDLEPAKTSGRPLLRLKRLKVKNRRATAFVVDAFNNVVGLLAAIPGVSITTAGTIAILPGELPVNMLSPRKFAVATFRPIDNDPRGQSILRPAYSPWWRKQQIIPEYLKYLAQFAGPSIIGFTAPGADTATADDVIQADPNVTYQGMKPTDVSKLVSPADKMLQALLGFHNGTAAVFPNGADVKPIVMQGEGEAFIRALQSCDQQITKAILTQELATEQSKNQARAAAMVHQDVLSTLVRMAKRHIAAMIRRQILMPWVVLNYGEKNRRLAPFIDLGETETRDQPGLWTGAAQLYQSGYFAPDQLPDVDAMIGLPVRRASDTLDSVQDQQPAQPSGGPGAPRSGDEPPPPTGAREPDTTGSPGRPSPVPAGRVPVRAHTRSLRGTKNQKVLA